MLATLVSEQRIFSVHLPERCAGKYWITDSDRPMNQNKLLSIEADETERRWKIKSGKGVRLFRGKEYAEIEEIYLQEGELYPLMVGKNADERAFLFAEAFTDDRSTYQKYVFSKNMVINIGKASDNQIVIDNPFVSGHHAKLEYAEGKWILQDYEGTNGIYVNKKRIRQQMTLVPGDAVFILGFKIIIGDNFIAMNNPGQTVKLNTDSLSKYEKNNYVDGEQIVPEENNYYYRSPRFRREIVPLELKVDMPTKMEQMDDTPIMLTLAPSMLMGVASFASGIVTTTNAINNGGNIMTTLPTLLMSVSMLCGMILFPIIMRSRDKKRKKQKEQERRDKYLKYLDHLREEIQRNESYQEELLRENNPPILQTAEERDFWERRLWSRTAEQSDFLLMRMGIGNAPLDAEITFPEDRFSIEDDIMRDELFAFQKEEQLLKSVPVCLSLLKDRVVGIVGDKDGISNLLNNILLQIILLHSYDEVKIICMCEEKDMERLTYVKWSQHSWDDEGKKRFFAVTEDNVRELSALMNKVVQDRLESKKTLPHYVILSTSRQLANKSSFLSDVLENKEIGGISVIAAYDEMKSLPKECSTVIELNHQQGLMTQSAPDECGKTGFMQDEVSVRVAERITRKAAQHHLDLQQGRYALPGMLTFLDMFGVGKYEHLNIMKRWEDNNPVMSLKTPVGVDTNGETFYLDLHEKYHGPHGLVAGMTGSGKSEFIITFILSLAVNYHPNEAAFVLIDYKGGGLTGAFDNEKYRLPHLAGTITNLDGGAITRSILSIKSELRRRQAIFNKARMIANEGTMDIYKYQKMFRDGLVEDPLPHLFIISDEFAELKSQQPEFMDQLISTARIGRSLGVHLILATQKPSGVVNEQIWANSKFKVCLKVQDKADSNDMLKRPDAAEIAETGRFYLQVGYNEIFEMGQSAWCGAPYMDSDVVNTELDGTIEVLDNLGNIVDKIKEKKTVEAEDHGKQIVRIMEYLDTIAKEEDIVERQLWLPEIPGEILLGETKKKYGYQKPDVLALKAVIGELDDPYMQKQELMEVDLTNGNMLLYGSAGSGKEMLLTAMLYSLYENYTAEELNVYLLDFGAEILKMFEGAPQTGGVMIDGDTECIENLFVMINREVRYRKKLFAEYAGDFNRYNSSGNDRVPYILLIINNYSHFIENYGKYEEMLTSLTRECVKYGIYFVLTSTTANGVRFRMVQNFPQLFVMQLNDTADYISILGNTGGVFPSGYKGRGIIKKDETYIFQTAHIVGSDEDELKYIKDFCAKLSQSEGDRRAKAIPVVPKFISGLDAVNVVTGTAKVPLGIAYDTYNYLELDFEKRNILQILSVDEMPALYAAGGLIEAMSAIPEAEFIVCCPSKGFDRVLDIVYEEVNGKLSEKIIELFQTAVARNNAYKLSDGCPEIDMHPIICILHGYGKYKDVMEEDAYDKLQVMLSKTEGFANMFFIITDAYKSVSQYSMQTWYTDRCGTEGVWVGNGAADQIRLSVYKKDKNLNKVIDENCGYYIERGIARKLRLVMPARCEEEMGKEEEY